MTQVQAPLLELGETARSRIPLPTIKNSDIGQEIKPTAQRARDNILLSETEAEKITSKPIFLGTIYRSSDHIDMPVANDIVKTVENNILESYYCEDILNDLLDRAMRIIDCIKPPQIKESRNMDFFTEATIPSAEVGNENIGNDSIVMNDLLENVINKINTQPD